MSLSCRTDSFVVAVVVVVEVWEGVGGRGTVSCDCHVTEYSRLRTVVVAVRIVTEGRGY